VAGMNAGPGPGQSSITASLAKTVSVRWWIRRWWIGLNWAGIAGPRWC